MTTVGDNTTYAYIITLRPRQNGRHFADDTFKRIFLNENVIISIKISLKFVPKGRIKIIPALVQIMAWRRPGDKPLSEPMMVRLPTHICVSRPQWVIGLEIISTTSEVHMAIYICGAISKVSVCLVILSCLSTAKMINRLCCYVFMCDI